jgi:hypothetical protein
LPAERYVAGVIAGESSVFRNEEALKAMAVAARTYVARMRGRHTKEGFDFCATTHCQRLDLDAIDDRATEAAAATQGELLWFGGKPAFPYTRTIAAAAARMCAPCGRISRLSICEPRKHIPIARPRLGPGLLLRASSLVRSKRLA